MQHNEEVELTSYFPMLVAFEEFDPILLSLNIPAPVHSYSS